jgi:nucleoside-diphosphate-sugar epimerase
MEGSYVVTGASGFIGGAVCGELVDAGAQVTALVRQSSETARLESLGVRLTPGDLLDRESLVAAFGGADCVVHAAALASDWAPREQFFEVNVEGTRNVVDACTQAGVQRLLHISTVEVFGHRHKTVYSEDSPYRPSPGWYGVTKTLSEQLVRSAMDRQVIQAAIVYPTWVYGPGDSTFVPELVETLHDGSLPYFRDAGEYLMGLVYVHNLTAAIRMILEHPDGMSGRYIVNDEPPVTFKTFVEALASRVGANPPRLKIPYGLAYAAAGVLETVSRFLNRKRRPLLTRQVVESLGNHVEYDTEAIKHLGYEQPYHFPETLDATLNNADEPQL